MKLIVDFSEFLGITRTQLVEDSVKLSASMSSLAAGSLVAGMQELARRYGEDAPITIRVVTDDDGNPEVKLLIDGLPADDVLTCISIDEDNGVVYVFADPIDWFPERLGTVQLGNSVMLTRPLMAITKLPWPPDPTRGMVARLGEIADLREQRGGMIVEFPTPAAL